MHRLLISGLACVLLVSPALASPPDAQTILRRIKAMLEPDRASTRTLVMTTRAEGETVEWKAHQARKKLADGNRILTVMSAPDEMKGVALLIWERQEAANAQWIYLPTLRRVRKILPVSVYESFLGSDFTFADLGFVELRDRDLRLLGEEKLMETPAYKIQETLASQKYYYSRIVTWVAKDSMVPLRRDFYDQANALWKTELFQDVAVIDGTPTVLRIGVEDKLIDSSSELRVSEVRYDAPVPDELFDPQKLSAVSKHPFWTTGTP